MNIADLCRQITEGEDRLLPPEHKLNTRLVHPEYSTSAQEVKTYPLLEDERIFALCWYIDPAHTLHATMCPTPEHFCCRYHFVEGEKTQLHTHDYIELAYVAEGEFRQKILGKDIVFSKGDLCLIDKNCLHQDYLQQNPAIVLFLGIANDIFSEIMDETVTTKKIISFLQSALLSQKNLQQYLHFRPGNEGSAELEENLAFLLRELYDGKIGSRYIRKGLLLRIFRIISTKYEFSLSKELRKTMNWIVFEEVSSFMHTHYNKITIQDLTNTFHFQEDYFNRLIKSKTGMTYSAYLQQIRLDAAEHLLSSTDLTVEEIAAAVGYHNKGYFYKIFLDRYHMTPSRYRKNVP